uniref:Uncharacterized protein MANES_02G173700 n=2 Tax=Rhizophora mucronata TaxID=61149 RepID=A0A2P2MJW1_RHIMU
MFNGSDGSCRHSAQKIVASVTNQGGSRMLRLEARSLIIIYSGVWLVFGGMQNHTLKYESYSFPHNKDLEVLGHGVYVPTCTDCTRALSCLVL